MRLARHSYATIRSVQGPLLFLERVLEARMGEVVRIAFPDGHEAEGEVLKIEGDVVLIEVVGDSRGLDMDHSRVTFTDVVKRAPLSPAVLGRVFDGSFRPIDDRPMFIPDRWAPVAGFPLNPVARERPQDLIETGLSTIDGLNTLVKGQKLPIFSVPGCRRAKSRRRFSRTLAPGPRRCRARRRLWSSWRSA